MGNFSGLDKGHLSFLPLGKGEGQGMKSVRVVRVNSLTSHGVWIKVRGLSLLTYLAMF
jgi:hypothetical protein